MENKLYGYLCTSAQDRVNKYGLFECGYANGYVAIPPDHPLYKVPYQDIENKIEVHGGLTYSGLYYPENKDKYELLDGDIPDNYWVFGFDTLHIEDDPVSCDRDYCISQVERLKLQLQCWE